MPNYRWKARITLDKGRSHQEVYVEASSMALAKQMILSIYAGCWITWGPLQS